MKMHKNNIIIGILGGMGSNATLHFFKEMLRNSPAKTDNDFIEVIIYNNTKIPDRTLAITSGGASPYRHLVKSIIFLEKSGANYIIMTCITAHFWYDRLKAKLNYAIFIDMIGETANYIKNKYPEIKTVGILATEGSIKSKLWHKKLEKLEIKCVVLNSNDQNRLFNKAVYGEKGLKSAKCNRKSKSLIISAVNQLNSLGAQAIIAGCTEISIAINQNDINNIFIDPIMITINIINEKCYNNLRGG